MLKSDIRPWGKWEEYINEENYRLKRIIINPGKRISLQRHKYRDEHWIIVNGSGKLEHNGIEQDLNPGDTVSIKKNDVHRIANITDIDLVFIEVQIGNCDETDIIRIEDDWNRQ